MKIGYLLNFEVCDSEGNESAADIFVAESSDGSERTVYAFEVDGPNPHPAEFLDYEQEAWLEHVTLIPVDEFEVKSKADLEAAAFRADSKIRAT
jgi:hypothetical protein